MLDQILNAVDGATLSLGSDEKGFSGLGAIVASESEGELLAITRNRVHELFTVDQRKYMGDNGFQILDKRILLKGERRYCKVYLLEAMRRTLALDAMTDLDKKEEKAELRRAQAQLNAMRKVHAEDKKAADYVREILENAKRVHQTAELTFEPMARDGSKKLAGIPTIVCSDVHYSEVVNPDEIAGYNVYNREIANSRLDRLFSVSMELLFDHFSGSYYDGLMIDLLGDMVSGYIHEELQRTNDGPMLPACFELAQRLAVNIRMVAKEFRKVHIVGIVGNHGRMDRKPTAKQAVENNYDYLVYLILASELAPLANVEMHVSTSLDYNYQLYDTRFNVTHGNQYKGGSGIGGIWPALFRGDGNKRKRSTAVGTPYDYTIMGHFHQYGMINGVIVNGSVKGYDEYAYVNNFGFDRARQALFITHPKKELSCNMPVIVDADEEVLQPSASSGFIFNEL